jgi:hypothetical protein
MAVVKVIHRKRGIVTTTGGSSATYTTIVTVNMLALLGGSGEDAAWGARMRMVFKNTTDNPSYSGFAEWCGAGYLDLLGAGRGSCRASTVRSGGPNTGVFAPYGKFDISGTDLLAQVSHLDASEYKWFADVEVWGYTIT